jgi:phosphate transport system substrate-binding protein
LRLTGILSRVIALGLFAAVVLNSAADPPSRSAPERATEGLAIIVHKSNPVENLTLTELRKLCLAQRRQWDHGRKVTVVLREPENAERAIVLEKIYAMKENDLERYFLQETFTGKILVTPKLLSTAAGVRRFVFNVPGAIGFVRESDLDDTIKVIKLEGKSVSDPAYLLQIPLK